MAQKPNFPVKLTNRTKSSKEFIEELNALTYLLGSYKECDDEDRDYIKSTIYWLVEWYYGVDEFLDEVTED